LHFSFSDVDIVALLTNSCTYLPVKIESSIRIYS